MIVNRVNVAPALSAIASKTCTYSNPSLPRFVCLPAMFPVNSESGVALEFEIKNFAGTSMPGNSSRNPGDPRVLQSGLKVNC